MDEIKNYKNSEFEREDDIVSFLLNRDINKALFRGRYGKFDQLYIQKIPFDDCIDIIHFSNQSSFLLADELTYGGLIDVPSRKIMDINYSLDSILKNQNKIKIERITREGIRNKVREEVNLLLKEYAFRDRDELISKFKDEINQEIKEKPTRRNQAINRFISGELSPIDEYGYECTHIYQIMKDTTFWQARFEYDEYWQKDMIIKDWFDDEKIPAVKIAKRMYDKLDIQFQMAKSIYRAMEINDIIKEISINENGQYDSFHKRRKMVEAIKNHLGVNLTISIQYGNEMFEFKFNRLNLLRSLTDSNSNGAYDWKKAYEPVSDFIKRNLEVTNGYKTQEFHFDNIVEIKYGKKTLYKDEKMQCSQIVNEKQSMSREI